jgi:hypothetical protein
MPVYAPPARAAGVLAIALVLAPPTCTKKKFERHVPVSQKYSGDSREEEPMSRAFWRGCLVVVALVAGGSTLASPAEPLVGGGTKLEWSAFNTTGAPGKFWQEMTTTTEQKMTVQGMEVKQNQSQTFFLEWEPEKNETDAWTVKQKIVGVKMNINIGGNVINYDSTAENQPPNPLTEFFQALKDAQFTLTISKKADDYMKITKIGGRQEFIDKLVKTNQQLDTLLKQILSEEALKQMADPTFAAVPTTKELREKGVAKDSKWESTAKLDMGPIGTYTTTYKYTVKDIEKDKTATLDVVTSLTYAAPAKSSAGGLPFQIVKGELTSKEGKGTVVFDLAKGRIQSSTMDLTLYGKLTIEIAGQTTEVTLDQTQKSTLNTRTENPVEKKK